MTEHRTDYVIRGKRGGRNDGLHGTGQGVAVQGGRMTQREILVEDKHGVETILCALEGIGPDLTDKEVIRAMCRCLWHILEYMIRRCGNV